jgi:integrase
MNTNDQGQSKELVIIDARPGAAIGQVANQAARSTLLEDYRARKSAQTLRRQAADIALFARFLFAAGVAAADIADELAHWSIVTWGLVEAFNRWQLTESYAIGSINVRLATVKAYAELAARAGHLASHEYALIKAIKGFRQAEGRNVDEKREHRRREHSKKGSPVTFSPAHAVLLKQQPYTRRGRRDALLMCLLLDLGLRVGEVADLDIADFDLDAGRLVFYRHKVNLTQEHDLSPDCLRAARAYLADCAPGQEALFVGTCSKERVNERTLNHRVMVLGRAIGLEALSPHDCRHFWATDALRNGTDIKSLQDAGGWSSPAMPLRYAESAKVANRGVRLSSTRRKEDL